MAVLKQKLNRKNESGTYDEIHLKTDATVISLSPTDETLLSDEISSLKSSVSNGKSAVASAITDKGVSTSATASFNTMANNIRSIPVGIFPSGSKSITSNGSYDISSFASVNVNVSGVVVAYIKATAPSGTTNIYANANGVNVNPIEVNGVYFFNIPSLGDWTIYGTRNGSTKSINVGVWSNSTVYSVDLTTLFAFKITLIPSTMIGDMTVRINGIDYYLSNESIAGDYYTTDIIYIKYDTRFSNKGYVYINGVQQTKLPDGSYMGVRNFTYPFTPTKDTRISGGSDSYSSRICYITY